jgi:hypothetical protein
VRFVCSLRKSTIARGSDATKIRRNYLDIVTDDEALQADAATNPSCRRIERGPQRE